MFSIVEKMKGITLLKSGVIVYCSRGVMMIIKNSKIP